MRLKEVRLKNMKTQQDVANAININQNTYSNYEQGKTEPNIETLIKLADYFHTTTDFLLDHNVPYLINKSEFSSDQLAVIDLLSKLDNEQIKNLIAYIQGLRDGKNN